jgi:hypothetical protein
VGVWIGVDAAFGVDVAIVCALGNVIAGLFLLLPVIADEHLRRNFVYGPRADEEGEIHMGLLWVFPVAGIFIGFFWWLLGRPS